jgi:hypothetical protein
MGERSGSDGSGGAWPVAVESEIQGAASEIGKEEKEERAEISLR